MRSSTRPAADREPILVGEGGVQHQPHSEDPIQAWIELMEVVEILRPPERRRPAKRIGDRYLL